MSRGRLRFLYPSPGFGGREIDFVDLDNAASEPPLSVTTDSREFLTLYGEKLAELWLPETLEFVSRQPKDMLSDELRARFMREYLDYKVCPRCGHEMVARAELPEGVVTGYCGNCLTHLVRVNRKVYDAHNGATGYLRVENLLSKGLGWKVGGRNAE